VLNPPPDWRYQYPPQKWHDKLIVEAVERVTKLPLEQNLNRPSGYDLELAKAAVDILNETYPESITLMELKYQFCEEPSDEVLSTVLNALRGDEYIDGVRALQGRPKLNPLERITLTAEGRRHLADEMKKRGKSKQGFSNNDASRSILFQLLSEFRDRQLTASDLHIFASEANVSPSFEQSWGELLRSFTCSMNSSASFCASLLVGTYFFDHFLPRFVRGVVV
jgi:hypothetical protein